VYKKVIKITTMVFLSSCEDGDETKVYCKCSALKSAEFESVGRWFEACIKRQRSEKSVSVAIEDKPDSEEDEDVEVKPLTADEKGFLLSLDPLEWKKQDHYRVLNIPHMRTKCSDDDIRKAYRKMVLRYHPDKKNKNKAVALPPGVNEENLFTCITNAYEQLSTREGRESFDSIDDTFDDAVPNYSSTSKQNFFKAFTPVFERNARWSNKEPVPLLGDINSTQDEVNTFYTFWYDFSSWRNYSYLDEENTEKAENREERRWMDRENKHMRQKRKKDEIQRIRGLVDNAFQNDPRMKKFKEQEKQKKMEIKQAKELAAQEKEKEKQTALEKERKIKEQQDKEAKEKAQKEKKEKEKVKKAAARDRKVIRQAVKNEKYFNLDNNEMASLERLEKSLESLSIQCLQELREVVEKSDKNLLKEKYSKYSSDVLDKLKTDLELKRQQHEAALVASKQVSKNTTNTTTSNWNDVELQLLVKATNLYPVGTASRWEVIASYINEHSSSENEKTGKDIINKVKNLKKLDPSLKEEVNKSAFKTLEKNTASKQKDHITAEPSLKDDGSGAPWSSDEQKLLEQALKTFNSATPERWEKIAGSIPNRSKKECMKRYKELVEMIKAKKAAASAGK